MFDSQRPESMDLDHGYPNSVEGQLLGANSGSQPRVTGNSCTMSTKIIGRGKGLGYCVESSVIPRPESGRRIALNLALQTPEAGIRSGTPCEKGGTQAADSQTSRGEGKCTEENC